MKVLKYFTLVMASLTIASCMGKSGEKANTSGADTNGGQVTIYYFHGEHRCPTCIAIENETKAALEINLKKEAESGKVELQVINADEGRNKQICEKYGVYGSTLLLVKGENVVNLTNMAFGNARRNPDKFREDLASEVKRLINS
ncbi:MAG: nitrophenyl compound nitroreductase subunit ArsF family protein [Bacteroidota bacterium]